MDLTKAIKERKSVRRYSDKKPDWRKIINAIDASRFAPMANNMFNLKFILVEDPDKIKQIKNSCQQDFVGQAQYVLVAISDSGKLEKFFGERGKIYSKQQAGAAFENILLKLTELKIATCWVGLFEEEKLRTVLKIPDEFEIEAVFPLGIETKIKTYPPAKPEVGLFLFFNEFGYHGRFLQKRLRTSKDAF